MRTLVYFILISSFFLVYGQKKHVCFSYDDLPIVSYGINDSTYQKDFIDKLILALKNNKIPAIGFVNENKLYTDDGLIQSKVELLNRWVDGGLELGNHTFSHPDYNSISFKEFSQDLIKGETITNGILSRNGKTIKYFRHPFLHIGNTKEKADSLRDFLFTRGYVTAPVTIDNDDYLFALAYKRTSVKKDTALALQIGHDYIDYMERKLKYYESQANKLFGRDINQILLLHASLLNSDYTDSLATMLRKNNYDFINMDKTLEDNAFKSDITVYGKWGISWIDRWALTLGKKGDFFKDEPETPDYIKQLSK
ncbi:MAG: polysaccharide deacetylase family protein [Ignavibacteriaceae bacterium]|jgi:peptidoglycan/xylan/chitin deacetylase (PgdA/CDA1 family)